MPSEIEQIKAVKEKYTSVLISLPNVTGVGIGTKVTRGVDKAQPAIQVFVSEKIALDELHNSHVIPTHLDGWPTDVVVMPPASKQVSTGPHLK